MNQRNINKTIGSPQSRQNQQCCGQGFVTKEYVMGRMSQETDEQVEADVCYVFSFVTQLPNFIQSYTYNGGSLSTDAQPPNTIDLAGTEQQIKDGHTQADWFDVDSGVTWELLTVSKLDMGGGDFRFTITFKNPLLNGNPTSIDLIDISGNVMESLQNDCT